MLQAKDLVASGFWVNKKLLAMVSPHHPRTQFTVFVKGGRGGGGEKSVKGIGSERACLDPYRDVGNTPSLLSHVESGNPFTLGCRQGCENQTQTAFSRIWETVLVTFRTGLPL